MKKCPFCAEEIQDEAIKCRYCGEFLDKKIPLKKEEKIQWFLKPVWLFLGFLCVGPLILPLIWLHPKFSLATKIFWTIIIIIISFLLWKVFVVSWAKIKEYNAVLHEYLPNVY